MGTVDIGGGDEHQTAPIEQKVGKSASLGSVVALEGGDDLLARLQDASLRWRELALLGRHLRGVRRPHIGLEERFVRSSKQQSLTRIPPLLVTDGSSHAHVRRQSLLGVHVAQDAKDDAQCCQPLESIHDIKKSTGASPRPTCNTRRRALIALDEQHCAEEVVALPGSWGAINRCGDSVQKATDLLLGPRKRALVDRSLDEVGIGKELPDLHRRGDELVHTTALIWDPHNLQPAIHNMNCSTGAIKTSYLPALTVCASGCLPARRCAAFANRNA